MKRFLRFKGIILSIFFLFLFSCSPVAITGRRQLNIVPDSIMQSMSLKAYGDFISTHKASSNAKEIAMVKRVGARISKAVEQYLNEHGASGRQFKWEFNLIDNNEANAWAMPGGKVVVYTGILPITQTESGLATVLGHEISHVIARHGAERMSQGLLVNFGGIALSKALEEKSDETKTLFMSAYGLGTQIGALLPYSRLHESEADHLGLIFMAMAGYDPHEAIAFWERMAASEKGGSTPLLLRTHPTNAKRIADLKKLLPEAMEYYKKNRK